MPAEYPLRILIKPSADSPNIAPGRPISLQNPCVFIHPVLRAGHGYSINTGRAIENIILDLSGENSVRTAPKNIDEYIAGFPTDIQVILEKMRLTIRKAAPEATEKISYQIPTFYLKGNLVHFAGFKQHIGFYPTSSGVEKFKNELSAYEISKGTIRFPLDKPIPWDLISKIVRFRVLENLERAEAKRK